MSFEVIILAALLIILFIILISLAVAMIRQEANLTKEIIKIGQTADRIHDLTSQINKNIW